MPSHKGLISAVKYVTPHHVTSHHVTQYPTAVDVATVVATTPPCCLVCEHGGFVLHWRCCCIEWLCCVGVVLVWVLVGVGADCVERGEPKTRVHRYQKEGELLVSASFDGTAKIWGMPACTQLKELRGHEGKIMSIDISKDSK
jgi:hypothetical protein